MNLYLTLERDPDRHRSFIDGSVKEYRRLNLSLWETHEQGMDFIDSVRIDKDDLLWLLDDEDD